MSWLRGNKAPYFSVTGRQDRLNNTRWVDNMGGCIHEQIEKKFRGQFSDLIALHLSDMDGAPLHDGANAFYFAGGCGHMKATEEGLKRYGFQRECKSSGVDYDTVKHLIEDPTKPVEVFERWDGTPNVNHLASHLRIPLALAESMVAGVLAGELNRDYFDKFVEEQKPRWKAEAEAAIKKHNLIIPTNPN